MGMWKNLNLSEQKKILPFEYTGFPLSKLNILVILGIIILIVIPLNILPYKLSKEKLRAVPWFYFFFIGMGFMILELIIIQKYTLFIGPSVYSIIVILFAMLLASGIGSRFAGKINDKIVFSVIAVWVLLDIFVFNNLTYSLGGLGMFPRIMITGIIVAPLGFFMGMPFPKAGLRVGGLIDWGFAVNGAASEYPLQ